MLLSQELENSTGRRSGVVNQNIDAPKRSVSLLDKSLSIGRLCQISRYGDDFVVCLARNLGRRCFQRLPTACADCDIDTLAGQCKGYRLADTGARSGDECRLPVHLEIHADSLTLNTAIRPLSVCRQAHPCQWTAWPICRPSIVA